MANFFSRHRKYSHPFTRIRRGVKFISDFLTYRVLINVFLQLEKTYNVLINVYDDITRFNVLINVYSLAIVRYNVLINTFYEEIQLYKVLINTYITVPLSYKVLINTYLWIEEEEQDGYNVLINVYEGGGTDKELFPNMGSNA